MTKLGFWNLNFEFILCFEFCHSILTMYFKNFDKTLFFSVLAILFMGLLILYSASMKYHSQNMVFRQAVWIFVGLIFLFIILRIDYQRFISISYLLYGINIFLLILVLFFGEARGGAHRWISIGGFNLQPSELAKITLVLALSLYIGRRGSDITKIGFLFKVFGLVLPAFLLILMEPDLGGALLLIPLTLTMLFMAGARIKHLIAVIVAGLGSLPFFWQFLKDYQKERLFVFINPNMDPLGSGYTIIQSKIAIGSGGLLGKGWLSGTQNQLNFLPERHTDFIFSVVERMGFFWSLDFDFLIPSYRIQGYKNYRNYP